MEKQTPRVLLVEDDEDLTFITAAQLKREGYEVFSVSCGQEALSFLEKTQVDAVLLDVMLPDINGQQLCGQLRAYFAGPVIFMSCLGDGGNIVDAFRQGGNDYLVKPVDPAELIERIEKNLSEKGREKAKRIWFRQFMMDLNTYSVYRVRDGRQEEKLDLSPTEYKLLSVLVGKPDEVHLYQELYHTVWGQDDLGDVRTLMVHASNLRKKIDYLHTDPIRTVRGVGYIFSDL